MEWGADEAEKWSAWAAGESISECGVSKEFLWDSKQRKVCFYFSRDLESDWGCSCECVNCRDSCISIADEIWVSY